MATVADRTWRIGDGVAGYTEAMSAAPSSPSTSERLDHGVLAVIRAFLGSSVRTSGAQLERVSRSFVHRIVSRSVTNPRAASDRAGLVEALATPSEPAQLSAMPAALVAGKVLQRFGPLKLLVKRAPIVAAAAALPAAYSSVSRGMDDVATVSSFLANRSRDAHVLPDRDRIRRVTVQLLNGDRIDPDAEPEHDRLVWSWLRHAARGMLPFAKQRSDREAGRIASVAVALDPQLLGVPVSTSA